MKDNLLEFYRKKIDFFDAQFLFFLREKIDGIQNIKISFPDNDDLLKNAYQKIDYSNKNRDYNSLISKKWFLDFLNFDCHLETGSIQIFSINFFISYLQSIDANIYFILLNRFLLVNQIGCFKKNKNLVVLDNKRWQVLLEDRALQAQRLYISKKLVLSLLEKIHSYSLQLQKDYG